MLSFEESIKQADEELSKIAYNAEFGANKGLRKAYSNKLNWFVNVVNLAKKGLEVKNHTEVKHAEWKPVEDAPTADVVEVVRCKYCKNRWQPHRCALWYATANNSEYFIERGDDFYCSYGERKE